MAKEEALQFKGIDEDDDDEGIISLDRFFFVDRKYFKFLSFFFDRDKIGSLRAKISVYMFVSFYFSYELTDFTFGSNSLQLLCLHSSSSTLFLS